MTFDEIAKEVDARGGCWTLRMEVLRDAHGVDRLGIHVRRGISDRLEALGLRHYPQDLPQYQWDEVRLTRAGSGIDRLIRAAISPGEANDNILRNAQGNQAELILSRVRELVCD